MSCTKTKTLPNLRLPISSGNDMYIDNMLPAVLTVYRVVAVGGGDVGVGAAPLVLDAGPLLIEFVVRGIVVAHVVVVPLGTVSVSVSVAVPKCKTR